MLATVNSVAINTGVRFPFRRVFLCPLHATNRWGTSDLKSPGAPYTSCAVSHGSPKANTTCPKPCISSSTITFLPCPPTPVHLYPRKLFSVFPALATSHVTATTIPPAKSKLQPGEQHHFQVCPSLDILPFSPTEAFRIFLDIF